MKSLHFLSVLIALVLFLFACTSNNPTVDTQQTTSTLVLSTATTEPLATITPNPTSTFQPTPTITLTPPATLEPEQAKGAIQKLLKESIDCAAPCFWGITPGTTTLGEAKNIFVHFGLQLKYTTTLNENEFYESKYEFDSGLSVSPLFATQNDVVQNISFYIQPEKQKIGGSREWLAYSPETLISRYGTPARVDFFVGRAAPSSSYAMDIYFDKANLIIEYYSYDLGSNLKICPLKDQIDSVSIWLGKNPENPPLQGVSLEKATSMTLEGFSKLMMGTPKGACFNLKSEMFP